MTAVKKKGSNAMKKRKIAEILYISAAVFFCGICIKTAGNPGKEEKSSGENLTIHATIVPTKLSNAPEQPEDAGEKPTQPAIPTESEGAMPQPAVPTEKAGTMPQPTKEEKPTLILTATPEPTKILKNPWQLSEAIPIKNENYGQYSNELNAWWFIRKNDHSPSGSGEGFPIAPYSAYYRDTTVTDEDKVVYLTFDCGYENGFTPAILDTLAEKGIKVLFFVTKNFITQNPEYVVRMKEEGHLVGNHTVRHLSSPSLTPEELEKELNEVAKTMYELTGYKIDPFFRPPMGEYSERTLKTAQDMGYSSIFWSIAFYDYDVDNQPGKAYVIDHFTTYHHNGTIVLLHNTSQSDTEALGDVIDLLKAEGYRFGMLTEVAEK